jgi:RNA polymerase sigma-70 factor, ECF subfamily
MLKKPRKNSSIPVRINGVRCFFIGGQQLTHIPDTRDSLLLRVADPRDFAAWEQFARLYRPVVYGVARKNGLQDADAHDVVQQVMIAVSKALPTWERRDEKTRFRHWLLRVARNATINMLTRRPMDRGVGGATVVGADQAEAESDFDSQIDEEYRRQLFRLAAEQVQARSDETTWRAFAMTTIEGLSIAEVSVKLGRTEAVIYASRSRIMRRLRDAVKKLEEEGDVCQNP